MAIALETLSSHASVTGGEDTDSLFLLILLKLDRCPEVGRVHRRLSQRRGETGNHLLKFLPELKTGQKNVLLSWPTESFFEAELK